MIADESLRCTAILEAAQLDLTPCTALHTLHVQCSPPRRGEPTGAGGAPARSLSWVLILLSRVRSPALEEIRIAIRSGALPLLNLEGLDVVLARACYGSGGGGLRRLVFAVDADEGRQWLGGSREEVERVLRERLPTANERRLIRLEYC